MKYRLLRDCPHGKAGSVWKMDDGYLGEEYRLFSEIDARGVVFPKSTFSDWFEEIKELKPFTKEQAVAIKHQAETRPSGSPTWHDSFNALCDWLDENTEK